MAKTPSSQKPIVNRKHLARLERENIQRRWLIIGAIVIGVMVLGTMIYGILDTTVLKQYKPVAKVGTDTIRVSEFENRVRYERWSMIRQYSQYLQVAQYFASDTQMTNYYMNYLQQISKELDAPSALGGTVLDRLIEERIIAQEAKTQGITVSDAEVDKTLHDAFGYFPDGTSTPTITPTLGATSTLNPTQIVLFPPTEVPTLAPSITPGSAATASATLEPATATVQATSSTPEASATPSPSATPYTLDGFKTALTNYTKQLDTIKFSEAQLREIVRSGLLRDKVFAIVTKDVQPVQEELWARHILVEGEATAKTVIERLKAGESFDKVAKEVSIDTGSAVQGGDLGWFAKGAMVAEFENAAFALNIGQISDPVKSSFGYHVIQLLGRENRPVDAAAFTKLKDAKFAEWLTALKIKITIKKYDLYLTVSPSDPTIPVALQIPTQSPVQPQVVTVQPQVVTVQPTP